MVAKGKEGQIYGDRKRSDRVVNTMQYADDASQDYTLETHITPLTSVTPIIKIEKKNFNEYN